MAETSNTKNLAYKRIMLKIGGESIAGVDGFGIDIDKTNKLAKKIKSIYQKHIQISIVMGGGNFWRGAEKVCLGMDRAVADEIGMLGTMMNCLALRDAFRRIGVENRLHTSLPIGSIAESYSRLRCCYHLQKGYIVIIGAGTGHPFFTTDTAAALRALELNADILIKATKVDGIYSEDPKKNPNAERFEHLTYIEAITKNIRVIDNTAITVCMNSNLPILVCDLEKPNNLFNAAMGKKVGSIITK